MRTLVFLLVAANLAFFAWTQGYFGERESPDAARLGQQLAADRLQILSRDTPPAPREVPQKKAVADRCLAFRGLAAADADAVEVLLGERFAALRRVRHVTPASSSWWVFLPPLANKAEADRKAAELKKLGVPEYFVVQDAGANRFAISLGIFSSEQAARERLDGVRAKGVKSAKLALRGVERPEQVAVEIGGPEALVESAREALASAQPNAKPAACEKP